MPKIAKQTAGRHPAPSTLTHSPARPNPHAPRRQPWPDLVHRSPRSPKTPLGTDPDTDPDARDLRCWRGTPSEAFAGAQAARRASGQHSDSVADAAAHSTEEEQPESSRIRSGGARAACCRSARQRAEQCRRALWQAVLLEVTVQQLVMDHGSCGGRMPGGATFGGVRAS
jgi:hypothetical protein